MSSGSTRQIILVLGMHRSGTSALAGVIGQLGMHASDNLIPSDSSTNPKGFWENQDVVVAHEELLRALSRTWDDARQLPVGWDVSEAAILASERIREILERDYLSNAPSVIKDPRMCRFVPLWIALLKKLDVKPLFLLIVRHPFEVADSLKLRDGICRERACLLWLVHYVEALKHAAEESYILVAYDQLLDEQTDLLYRVFEGLGVKVQFTRTESECAVGSFLDCSLKHHTAREDSGPGAAATEAIILAESLYEDISESGGVIARDALARYEVKLSELLAEKDDWLADISFTRSKTDDLIKQNLIYEREVRRIKRLYSWRLLAPIRIAVKLFT